MGRLIIDGNSFFEIDEECIKKKKIPKQCDLDKYLKDNSYQINTSNNISKKKKSSDG